MKLKWKFKLFVNLAQYQQWRVGAVIRRLMIFLLYSYDDFTNSDQIKAAFEIKTDIDVEARYKSFIREKARELNLVINKHWLNIMDHEACNYHFSESEYKELEKKWKRIMKHWTLWRFITKELGGKRIPYRYGREFKAVL